MAAKRKPSFREFHALMLKKLSEAGSCLPESKMIEVWGKEAITAALEEGIIKVTVLKKQTNDSPCEKIRAIHTPDWDRSRPAWF